MKINAITISGNTRITLRMNLVIPVTGRTFTKLRAPKMRMVYKSLLR